ncbi:hypothetical protein CCR75_001383 [Bremia lactucae]|uniref:J domain-containing protein n=1 Tax=Bremia lactucae TaxID=4779 RepID=A0A976IAS5_BRELC|nr:hypothetical protein CCR75_001383 [Bremia lactucae]
MSTPDSSMGFLTQMFIVSPAISWILKPGRYSKRRGFIYSVAFLVAITAITIGSDLYSQEGNFYHVIGVDRDASYADIKRAFRQRSVELHPDKNPSPSATEDFNRLRMAFDVLGDGHKRSLYDLFGEEAVTKELWTLQIETIAGSITFYVCWAVITFVLTLSDKSREVRAWSFAAGVLSFVMELNLIYGRGRLPPYFFPRMTVHDFIIILHTIFPPFLNGCRAIGVYFHHDFARENFALSVELLKSNQAILLNIRQLQGEVASSSRRRLEVMKDESVPAAVKKRLKVDSRSSLTRIADPLADDVAVTEALRDIVAPKSEVQEGGVGIPRWVWGIGLFLAFNYFTG